MRRWASLLVVVACSPEVRVDDPSGSDVSVSSSSSSISVGAGGSGAGGSGVGASGGGGAGGSPGVPGCEVLVRAGEMLKVPGSYQGHLLDAGNGRVGAVYQSNNGAPGSWAIRSRVFDSQEPWPASWTQELTHAESPLETQYPASSREDGLMVVRSFIGWVIASFFQPGGLMQTPAGAYGLPILEPLPSGGAYWRAEGELRYYPSYDATEPSSVLPFAGNGPVEGVDANGELVLLGDEGFSVIQDGQLVALGDLGVELPVSYPSLLPREGGFWLSYLDANAVVLLGVSKAGATEPYRPFGDDAVAYPADRSFDLTPWRNGVALATVGGTPEARLLVGVTDGEHTTVFPLSSDEVSFCENGLSVVSSPDGDSIYLGYLHCPPDEIAFVVERFDCASP